MKERQCYSPLACLETHAVHLEIVLIFIIQLELDISTYIRQRVQ